MIDEYNLQIKINSLVALQTEKQEEINKIIHVLESLQDIRQENGANPTDIRVNQIMSDVTRQEIYDVCISTADEILGILE